MLLKWPILFLLIPIGISGLDFTSLSGPLNFVFHEFFECTPQPAAVTWKTQSRWLNKTYQVLDSDFVTSIPIGDHINAKVAAYKFIQNSKWVYLSNITCTFCNLLHNYLGPVRNVLLTSIGLMEDTCPIPAGEYHSRSIHIDMKKSRIPLFPYGLFKIYLALHNVSNDKVEGCLGMVLENKPSHG